MIELPEALEITKANFPNGPEALAQRLGIRIEKSEISGCHGWCVRGKVTIVRINRKTTAARQRFTLAHELAHVVLGTPPDVSTPGGNSSEAKEEEIVNRVAAVMLLPVNEVTSRIRDVPLSFSDVTRISRDANVSEIAVAMRIVTLAERIGLSSAIVADFVGGRLKWMAPRRAMSELAATQLFAEARRTQTSILGRRPVSLMILQTPFSESLFAQFLAPSPTHAEPDSPADF